MDLPSSSEVEDASSGGYTTPVGVISTSHRSSLWLNPIHLFHAAKLPEYLKRLVAMRSACDFQTNDYCRSSGRQSKSKRLDISTDGDVGSITGGLVGYLSQAGAKASLSHIDSKEQS